MEQFGQMAPRPVSAGFGEDVDPDLARAIEASYHAQTGDGMGSVEDDMLAEALRLSQAEEDARKRRELGLPPEDDAMLVDEAGFGHQPHVAMSATEERRPVPEPMPAPFVSRRDHEDPMGDSGIPAWIEAEVAAQAERQVSQQAGLDDAFMADHAEGGQLRGAELGEASAPGEMDAEAILSVAEQAERADRELAMAIEASYVAQTEDGRAVNEDDLMAQALRISQQEEESRQRASLREAQEQELQESILMDQMREQEEKRRCIEEQELQKLEDERLQEEAKKKEAEEKAKQEEQEQKKNRIPDEPPAGEPGRGDLMIRLPDGKRLRRAFRSSDTIGQVYDYVDVEACASIGQMEKYRLVSTMPRQCYEERGQTLADAGLKGQIALVIEPVAAAC